MPAIPAHSSATTEAAWNAAENERRINTPVDQTVAAHFWAWREAGDWPTTKGGYRFPHHEVSDGGQPGAANLRACSSVIAILNGARGGTDIPSSDKQGVYDHVAKHLKAGGKEPPPLGTEFGETLMWAGRECGMTFADLDAMYDASMQKRVELLSGPTESVPARELPPLVPLGHAAWAIRADVFPRLAELQRSAANLAPLAELVEPRAQAEAETSGGIIVTIPLCGVITPCGSLLSMLFGGGAGGLERFRAELREAVASSEVKGIVIDIDSPGGLVSLVPETAAELRAARGTKPIVAVCNTLAASAAYWIAAQADEVVCTPSGEAGSIGVYMVHEDYSSWNEKFGVDPTYIKAGRYKAEGNPDEPLGDAAEGAWQQEVDDIYATFAADVAAGRGTSTKAVQEGYGEGRCLLAPRALEAGLVDRIATVETVMAELAAKASSGSASARTFVLAGGMKVSLVNGMLIGPDGKPLRLEEEPAHAETQCPNCGRYMSEDGECENCAGADDRAASASDDEDDREDEVEDREDAVDDDDEDDEDDEPKAAALTPGHILFG